MLFPSVLTDYPAFCFDFYFTCLLFFVVYLSQEISGTAFCSIINNSEACGTHLVLLMINPTPWCLVTPPPLGNIRTCSPSNGQFFFQLWALKPELKWSYCLHFFHTHWLGHTFPPMTHLPPPKTNDWHASRWASQSRPWSLECVVIYTNIKV